MAESIRRSYRDFVGVVADVLDEFGIEYGIAGSFTTPWPFAVIDFANGWKASRATLNSGPLTCK